MNTEELNAKLAQADPAKVQEAEKFLTNLMVVLEYAIKKTHTDIDDTVILVAQKQLGNIDLNAEAPDEEALTEAVFGFLNDIADLTPTQADDKAVKTAEALYGMFGGKKGIELFVEKIKALIAARKAKQQAKKENQG